MIWTTMKGLMSAMVLTGTILLLAILISPKDESCKKWDVKIKRFLDQRSGLILTDEVAVCVKR